MADRFPFSKGRIRISLSGWNAIRSFAPSDSGAGWIPELSPARISNRIKVTPDISTPWGQRINFETPTQFLGLTDVTMLAVVIVLISRVGRHLFLQIPNYLDTDRSADIDVTYAIHIARICHNVGFGRLRGRAMPGPKFIHRLGLLFPEPGSNDSIHYCLMTG